MSLYVMDLITLTGDLVIPHRRMTRRCLPHQYSVASNGQELCTHEDALTQVAHCGPCRFGQSEIYFSLRSVTVCFEQTRMNCRKPTA